MVLQNKNRDILTPMNPYEEIAQAIIQKQMIVIGGNIALSRARKVPGLEVGEGGKVKKLSEKPVDAIEELIIQYSELLGPAGVSFAKDAALPIVAKNPGLLLPRSLQG